MSDEYTERPQIVPLLQEERDIAALEPQQHSTLAHQVATQLLMATFNKKTKKIGMPIDEAVYTAAAVGNIVLSPAELHRHYHEASIDFGRENAYHHSIQAKIDREAEKNP